MRAWRWGVGIFLTLALGVPLALPFLELCARGRIGTLWSDDRLLGLATNTLLLAGGTMALALPLGIAAAILLFRTDLPFRRAFTFLTVLALFVPLPLVVAAWLATFGGG